MKDSRSTETLSRQFRFTQIPITMSGAAQGGVATAKATVSDSKDNSKPLAPQKPVAQLEEDDEFEDFPVEGTPEMDCARY